MDYIFKYSLFTGDISNWDVSNVTSMDSMFYEAKNFADIYSMNRIGLHNNIHSLPISIPRMESDYMNGVGLHNQILNNWNVSNIINMESMFCGAERFADIYSMNRIGLHNNIHSLPISISQMESDYMNGVGLHNQPLDNWDVSKVTSMKEMFYYAINFTDIHSTNEIGLHNNIYSTNRIGLHNQNLNSWNVSNVTNMKQMFAFNSKFNSPLNDWDVSKVTSMAGMFESSIFNQDLNSWNTSNVISMRSMFLQTFNFNSQLNNWDTSNVKDMSYIFRYAQNFNNIYSTNRIGLHNQSINNWDVSNVTSMESMFEMSQKFNQNISNWNLDKIEYFDFMFEDAKAFLDKYNSSKPLPYNTNKIKEWFNNNRERMNEIDIKNIKNTHGKEIDDFFYKINDIYSINKDK